MHGSYGVCVLNVAGAPWIFAGLAPNFGLPWGPLENILINITILHHGLMCFCCLVLRCGFILRILRKNNHANARIS